MLILKANFSFASTDFCLDEAGNSNYGGKLRMDDNKLPVQIEETGKSDKTYKVKRQGWNHYRCAHH